MKRKQVRRHCCCFVSQSMNVFFKFSHILNRFYITLLSDFINRRIRLFTITKIMQHNLISYVPRIVQYTGKFKFGLFSRFQLNVKRSIGSYSNGRVKCWNCGIEKNSSELTFQCSECQRLLMLPDHVVNNESFASFLLLLD